jgi:hypothetical protein
LPKAKSISAISASDIAPRNTRPLSATRQRGVTASDELVSLGFKLEPGFIQDFKRAALDKGMKLNEFLTYLFREFAKVENRD